MLNNPDSADVGAPPPVLQNQNVRRSTKKPIPPPHQTEPEPERNGRSWTGMESMCRFVC